MLLYPCRGSSHEYLATVCFVMTFPWLLKDVRWGPHTACACGMWIRTAPAKKDVGELTMRCPPMVPQLSIGPNGGLGTLRFKGSCLQVTPHPAPEKELSWPARPVCTGDGSVRRLLRRAEVRKSQSLEVVGGPTFSAAWMAPRGSCSLERLLEGRSMADAVSGCVAPLALDSRTQSESMKASAVVPWIREKYREKPN